jgi:hypothetical protein
MADDVPCLVEDLAAGQADDIEEGLKEGKLLRLQRSQKPVHAMGRYRILGHGDTVTLNETTLMRTDRPSSATPILPHGGRSVRAVGSGGASLTSKQIAHTYTSVLFSGMPSASSTLGACHEPTRNASA